MKHETRELLETGVRLVTEYGCMKAVSCAVNYVTPANISMPAKVCIKVGTSILGAAAGEYAADWVIQEAHYIKKAYENGELVSVIIG